MQCCDPSPTGPWPPRSGTRSATANTPTAVSCPPRSQLSASYSVSRQTVRRAMQDLVSEGIIYRVAGRGTYPVAEEDRYVNHFGSVEELMALSLDTECQVVSPLQRKVDVETASRLRLPRGRGLHGGARPPARRHPVLLHLGVPAAADRAAADRRGRAVLASAQPGDGHRADRRADEADPSPPPSRASARPAPRRWPPGTWAARPASRCSGSTACTSTTPTTPSSSPSATSTPSTTPTGSSSGAGRCRPSGLSAVSGVITPKLQTNQRRITDAAEPDGRRTSIGLIPPRRLTERTLTQTKPRSRVLAVSGGKEPAMTLAAQSCT